MYSLDLPYVTYDLPGTGGRIRETLEDFIVEEIPIFDPTGLGEHLFVNLTKRGIDTRRLALGLASLLDLPRTAVGYAGLKDVRSISTQTISLHIGASSDDRILKIGKIIESNYPVKVNWMRRHHRKLRAGQLLGNAFSINITGILIDFEEAHIRAIKIANVLGRKGLPNYYGYQRVDTENVRRGYGIIKGSYARRQIRSKWLRRFLVSSYLDHLCNFYLSERIKRGSFSMLLEGDIAKKHSTGGMFAVEDPDKELARYLSGEISFTAPIYGPRMWWAEGPSGDFEKEIFEKTDITLEELRKLNVRGTRRIGRILPEIIVKEIKNGINVRFTLKKGAYATIVMREIMKEKDNTRVI